jgi:3-phosphoshikimate 1-carboxyvinyltransferase
VFFAFSVLKGRKPKAETGKSEFSVFVTPSYYSLFAFTIHYLLFTIHYLLLKTSMKVKSANYLQGIIQLPGDKSISHRAAMFAAMAEGETKITNFATSADCASTLSCLEKLGVWIKREENTVFIEGLGKTGFTAPTAELDCGNSGSTMRMMAGILAGQNFESVLAGDESLSRRPMKRVIEPLELMNARIDSTDNHAPLRIYGKNPLQPITYASKVSSAQVKSCVLLAGLFAAGRTIFQNPPAARPVVTSRNHTELMLGYLGAQLEERFIETESGFVHEIAIDGSSTLKARDLNVPSDISSAAFFLVAAACLPGSEITLPNVGLNPTRRGIVEVLQSLGAEIEILNEQELCKEIVGELRVRGAQRLVPKADSNIVQGDVIANIIDEIPILSVFGTQLEGGLEIRNAEELRVKESDRIKTVVENLRRMGAAVEEFPDGLRVEKSALRGATVDSFGDHRIAMAFAVAGLFADGETEITGAEWAAVSFPAFFEKLKEISK